MSRVITIARALATQAFDALGNEHDERDFIIERRIPQYMAQAQAVDDALDEDRNPDAQLLSAIAHGRDEDVEGRVIPLSIAGAKPVSDIEREREERFAIADMLRAATTIKAVETAFDRLRHHLDVHG
jgi:hypothetical protein